MRINKLTALAAWAVSTNTAFAEQTIYQYDAECLAEKTSLCVKEAKDRYSDVHVSIGSNANSTVSGICTYQSEESDISHPIADDVNAALYNAFNTSHRTRATACDKWGIVTLNNTSTADREKRTPNNCYQSCKNISVPINFEKLCYDAALARPAGTANSCVIDFQIPDVEFQEDQFILALNKIAEEVKGLGQTDLKPDPTANLACPSGRSSIHFKAQAQQEPLSVFANWLDDQLDASQSDRVPSLHQEDELKFKRGNGDGPFITIQYFDPSQEDLAFDWHRFAQTALAAEVRVYRVGKDFANHEPFDKNTIEIVTPENVELAKNPYVRSCDP